MDEKTYMFFYTCRDCGYHFVRRDTCHVPGFTACPECDSLHVDGVREDERPVSVRNSDSGAKYEAS